MNELPSHHLTNTMSLRHRPLFYLFSFLVGVLCTGVFFLVFVSDRVHSTTNSNDGMSVSTDVMVDSEGTLAFDISTTSEIEKNKQSVPVLPSDTLYGTTSYYPMYENTGDIIYVEQDRRTFTVNGMPGAVVSVCGYLHLYLHPDHLTDLCLQEYKLILEWDNNKYIIDESRSGTVDVRGSLGVIRFNRNYIDADSLSADFDDTTLMLFVQVRQPECLGSVIQCAFGREAPFAYRINFPEISITHLDRNRLDFSGFRITNLIWNDAGTKAFSVSAECTAGCLNQVLEIYDAVTDTYSTILNRDIYLQLVAQYDHMMKKDTPISNYFKWTNNETISFFNEIFFVQ